MKWNIMFETKRKAKHLIIQKLTPSLNVLLRTYFRERKRDLEDWGWQLIAAGCRDIPDAVKGEKRTVEMISYRKKLVDTEGLYGGMKNLLDAMVNVKLIYDDDPKHLILSVDQALFDDRFDDECKEPFTKIVVYWEDKK